METEDCETFRTIQNLFVLSTALCLIGVPLLDTDACIRLACYLVLAKISGLTDRHRLSLSIWNISQKGNFSV